MVTPPSDLSVADEEAKGEVAGGREIKTGSCVERRHQQGPGRSPDSEVDAEKKSRRQLSGLLWGEQLTSCFRTYCVVVVVGPGGACHRGYLGALGHCVTGTFFPCVALPQPPMATKQNKEQVGARGPPGHC